MIVVSDTSPINYLVQVGEASLLKELFTEVIIPPTVLQELQASQAHRAVIATFLAVPWLKMKTPSQPLPSSLRFHLDKGESEAIALAIELKADYLIIDERKGALVANDLHLQTVGLAGVLIRAKKEGLIEAVKPLLDKIIAQGFYLTERFYKNMLSQINE